MSQLIYDHKRPFVAILPLLFILLFQFLTLVLLFWYPFQQLFSVLLILPIALVIAVFQYKKYSIPYQLFEDRLEIYPTLFSSKKEILPLDLFFQARFEDEFNSKYDFFGALNSDVIFLYTNKDVTSSWIRKNRLELPVSDWNNREVAITKILRLFQGRGMQLFVKTKRKPMLKNLGIRNWN